MASVDFFLKLDGIEGESTDNKHKGEIVVEDWAWSENQPAAFGGSSGGGAGKVTMNPFHFSMTVNKATPKLILACATGQHIKTAVLICRKAGKEQQEFLKIKFSECMIAQYSTGGSGNSDALPTDQIDMHFSKIEYEYKEQKSDGTLGGAVKAGYDLKAMKTI